MSTFFIFVFTSFLLGLCIITVLFILMQRPSEESGMGATLGGNAVTSILGGEGINTLAKITKYCVALFFCLSFFLSLLHMAREKVDKPQNLFEKKEVVTAMAALDGSEVQKDTTAETMAESALATENSTAETEKVSEKQTVAQ